MDINVKYQNNLELIVKCDRDRQTIAQHQYTTYPLRLSSAFYLEGKVSSRAYHYLINTSPGLLAGDELNLSLHLQPNTNLYLTDQAATKVHPMPNSGTRSALEYQITLDANASLELVPEPTILYTDAALEQKIKISLHPTAKLFISEIILPGRLAKQEYYDFNYYLNRLQITDLSKKNLFIDTTRLAGKNNQFKTNKLFTSLPIVANAIAILPDTDLNLLIERIENISLSQSNLIEAATTILPSTNGILIRALGQKTSILKQYITAILNCTRSATKQASLPHIPK